jgi:hypothetical protein
VIADKLVEAYLLGGELADTTAAFASLIRRTMCISLAFRLKGLWATTQQQQQNRAYATKSKITHE